MSTVVIHGTLARPESWWRLSGGGDFLAAVAEGMTAGGRSPHDIWTIGGRLASQFPELRPAVTRGFFGTKLPPFDQTDGHFCWSGANVHRERLDGGKALALYLDALAKISPEETIDIVAHSHGANLVKVASNHVGRQTRLGRLVFLAAPHCGIAQIGWMTKDYPYRLHPSWAASGGAKRVLNLYSAGDPVQTRVAGNAPDSWGAPPGLPGLSQVFDAYRVDSDPQAEHAYDNVEIPTLSRSLAEHGALHNVAIGRLVGLWLTRWPDLSGEDCRRHFLT